MRVAQLQNCTEFEQNQSCVQSTDCDYFARPKYMFVKSTSIWPETIKQNSETTINFGKNDVIGSYLQYFFDWHLEKISISIAELALL